MDGTLWNGSPGESLHSLVVCAGISVTGAQELVTTSYTLTPS